MLRYGVRAHLMGVLGYGAFLSTFALVEVTSWTRLNPGSAQQAAFGAQMELLANRTTYLLADPGRIEGLPDYLQWFLIGFIPVFFAVWALIAGTGAFRGEEESGLLEQWLASGLPRGRLIVIRLAGFTIAITATALLVDAVAAVSAAASGVPIPIAGLLEQSLAESAIAPAIFMLGALLAQVLPTRRNALGTGALVLGALFFLNASARSTGWLRPWRWVSPWAYTDLSSAMARGGRISPAGVGLLVLVTVALGIGTWLLMHRRDLGAGLLSGGASRPPARQASRNPLTAWPPLNAVWEQRVGLATWSVGIGIYALLTVPLAPSFVKFMASPAAATGGAQARIAFGFGAADPVAGFISASWFRVACILLAAFAITQVARWSGEDAQGRLEMVLAAGRSRWAVVADRGLSLLAGLVVLTLADFVAVLAGIRLASIDLEMSKVALAAALVLPVALAFGAAGAAISAFRPRVAVWSLSALVAFGYLVPLVAVPIFRDPPRWFLDLSPFQLYGSPLTAGVDWQGLWILAAVIVAGFAGSGWALQRREVGT